MTDDQVVRLIQADMKRAGLYHGAVDGDWGPQSRRAYATLLAQADLGPAPPVQPAPPPERPATGGRLAILIGHNATSQGAVRVTDGRTEYDWNDDLAQMIRANDPARVQVFRRTHGGGYRAEIRRAYDQIAAWRPDAILELHFNAFSPDAHGCEMLYNGSAAGARLADALQRATLAALGNRDRGIKVLSAENSRGGPSVHALPGVPTIITEPYFGSNPRECVNAGIKMRAIADAQFRAAMTFIAA